MQKEKNDIVEIQQVLGHEKNSDLDVRTRQTINMAPVDLLKEISSECSHNNVLKAKMET